MQNLRILPKVRDSWSYLYVEHARIDQEDKGICLHDEKGRVHVPCASLSLLMLGPGTTVTHAAIRTLAECGCLVAWCGEQGVRFYAQGMGETRSSARILRQARLWADDKERLRIVRRMYEMRFGEPLPSDLTLRQIRGKEGARVRAAYAQNAERFGVEWSSRRYDRLNWDTADPINRALSAANSCLYGVCHAAIVAAGYSPAIGFIHTGKMLSFVYDVADLYKTELTLPAAFIEVAKGGPRLESRVRHRCRDLFAEHNLLGRIVDDLDSLFGTPVDQAVADRFDEDEAAPGELWDPTGNVSGGQNYEGE
ncbi:MAG: type I-E CRISPR-associated endonuclease Cas1e [Symbiobacterium sp.]|uniref:type I-E CRISPR-associated endonuclease Cas1e n=1 Tax=Symbiobacterium sp. TaxID=1971213 RepID=UPI0034643B49